MGYLQDKAVPQDKDADRAENAHARSHLLSPEFLVPDPIDHRCEPIDEKRNCAWPPGSRRDTEKGRWQTESEQDSGG